MITQEITVEEFKTNTVVQQFKTNMVAILNDEIAILNRELDSLILAREEVPAQFGELTTEISYVKGKIDQTKATIRLVNIYA